MFAEDAELKNRTSFLYIMTIKTFKKMKKLHSDENKMWKKYCFCLKFKGIWVSKVTVPHNEMDMQNDLIHFSRAFNRSVFQKSG